MEEEVEFVIGVAFSAEEVTLNEEEEDSESEEEEEEAAETVE